MRVHLCVALWLTSLHLSPVFYFIPLFSFQPFQMFTSEFNERSRSNPLCDFRLGTVATSDHETPLTAGKGDNSLQHYNVVHNFIPVPQAMKIPAAKAAVDKKNGENFGVEPDQSQKQGRGDDGARTSGAKVHFSSLMDICHLKNAELEAKHQKYKGRAVLRGYIVKDDSGSCAVQRSSAS